MHDHAAYSLGALAAAQRFGIHKIAMARPSVGTKAVKTVAAKPAAAMKPAAGMKPPAAPAVKAPTVAAPIPPTERGVGTVTVNDLGVGTVNAAADRARNTLASSPDDLVHPYEKVAMAGVMARLGTAALAAPKAIANMATKAPGAVTNAVKAAPQAIVKNKNAIAQGAASTGVSTVAASAGRGVGR